MTFDQARSQFKEFTRPYWLTMVTICLTLLVWVPTKRKILMASPTSENHGYLVTFTAIFFTIAGFRIKMADLPYEVKIVLRTVFSLFAFYFVAAHPVVLDDYPMTGLQKFEMTYGPYVFAALLIGALFRPALAVFPLIEVVWQKKMLMAFSSIKLSMTDYAPLIEISIFMVIFIAITDYLLKSQRVNNCLINGSGRDRTKLFREESTFAFLFAFSVHMANYFYSGHEKVVIGNNFLDWPLHNETYHLISNAFAVGQLPLTLVPGLAEQFFNLFSHTYVLSNLLIFFGQLFAIVCIFRIRWALWTTLFYDLTHAVIFVVSGIFFYKWIILNLSLVWALKSMRGYKIPHQIKILMLFFVLSAPAGFFVARLGWWDTPMLERETYEAVFKDGEKEVIPTNFWRSYSLGFAQQRSNMPDYSSGVLPTYTYGITKERSVMASNICNEKLEFDASDPKLKLSPKLVDFIKGYLTYSLANFGQNKYYDVFPHHIFSMFWEFDGFRTSNKENIIEINYRHDAICTYFKDMHFGEKLLGRIEDQIDVR